MSAHRPDGALVVEGTTTTTSNTLIAAASGKKHALRFIYIQNNSASETTYTLSFGSLGSTDQITVVAPAKGDGIVLSLPEDGAWVADDNTAVVLTLSAGNSTHYALRYHIVEA